MKRIFQILTMALCLIPGLTLGQNLVTGRVIDAETKKGIKEAEVTIAGTSVQTKTNVLGYFQVDADTSKSLMIKRDGYEAGEIKVPAAKAFQVQLSKDLSPEYEGGMAEFHKKLTAAITYPDKARNKNTQGRVYVTFEVDSVNGIQNIQTLKDIGHKCGDEVASALKKVQGKWIAKTKVTTMILPVTFHMTEIKLPAPGADLELPKGKLLDEVIVNAPKPE